MYADSKNTIGLRIKTNLSILRSLWVKPGRENTHICRLISGVIVIIPKNPEIIQRNSDHFSGWYKFKHSSTHGLNIPTKYPNIELMFKSHGIEAINQIKIRIPVLANSSLACVSNFVFESLLK